MSNEKVNRPTLQPLPILKERARLPQRLPQRSPLLKPLIVPRGEWRATEMVQLLQKGCCSYYPLKDQSDTGSIYAFDLDSTLIRTRSGAKFAKDAQDWVWISERVPDTLGKIIRDPTQKVIIITNQKGVSSGKTQVDDIKQKILAMISDLQARVTTGREVDRKTLTEAILSRFGFYIAGGSDKYRKPWTGIWDLIRADLGEGSLQRIVYYCGDAAGRPSDFSSSDRYFAENAGIPFRTPEEIFDALPPCDPRCLTPYPAAEYLSQDFTTTSAQKYLERTEALLQRIMEVVDAGGKMLIILVGGPGSGKSTLARKICEQVDAKQGRPISEHIERDLLGGNSKRFLKAISQAMSGESTIQVVMADATHPNAASREQLIKLVQGEQCGSYLILHVDTPKVLCQHQDCVRVQLGFRESPIPPVGHNSYWKRFRDDIANRVEEEEADRWFRFSAQDPESLSRPEYLMHFL